MSKFIGIIVGGIEIALGAILVLTGVGAAFGALLISAGIGTVLSGVGTLISGSGGQGGNQGGTVVASRNPIAPWQIIYGRCAVGGTITFINEFGDSNKYLDLVIVLAAHTCESVDRLLFDKQYVQLDSNGDSFTPVQQTIAITSIARVNGVVTIVLDEDIPLLLEGDLVAVENVTGDLTLNGKYPASEIVHGSGTMSFVYICGGSNGSYGAVGDARTLWPDYGRKVHMETLLGDHSATFPGMLTGTPNDGDTGDLIINSNNPWTSTHKLLGKTCVFLRLHYDAKVFSGGIPSISFLVHGKNDILDPRTSPATSAYTENAALCIADYLHNSTWGFKAAYVTEIPSAELISAANICDEAVALAAGGTEPRYTCNGRFDLSVKRAEILQNLLTSCGGRLTYQGGKFIIWPAAWRGSSPLTSPGIGSMSGPFRWRSSVTIRDLFNGVKGSYISPINNWHPSDIPPYAQDVAHGYSSDSNLIADGNERRWLDIQLPFTISSATAQRLCKIELLRRRQQGTGTFRFNMSGYQIAVMDVLSMTVAYLGWSAKKLEVLAHRFTLERQQQDGGQEVTLLGTEIDVQETDSAIYDWSTAEELTPQGYQQISMPNPFTPAPPTDLVLESDADTAVQTPAGIVDAILVEWTAPDDGYVANGGRIEIQYQLVSHYMTGSVAATHSSASIVGSGTDWTDAMVGAAITLAGVDYEVAAVADPTHATLSIVYAGSTASGISYVIAWLGPWKALPSVNATVTEALIVGVLDHELYNVQIRSVGPGGYPSDWVTGSVVASAASKPMPWKPFGEARGIISQYGYEMAQEPYLDNLNKPGQQLVVYGYWPPNTLSETITEVPTIDSIGRVTPSGGGAWSVGHYVGIVHAIDSTGRYSAASTLMRFAIVSATSIVQFYINLPAGSVQYEIFIGAVDRDHLVGNGKVSAGSPPVTSAPILVTMSSAQPWGYGPPDVRAMRARVQAKREIHAGIFAANVVSSTFTTVVIGIPSALTSGAYNGFWLSLLSKVGLPSSQPFTDVPITGTATDGTLTVTSPLGIQFAAGDLVVIRAKATVYSATTIGCSKFVNPFATGGLDVDAEKGNEVWVFYLDLHFEVRDIISNTSTTLTVRTAFDTTPDGNCFFIICEKGWPVDVTTGDIESTILPSSIGTPALAPVFKVPVTAIQGNVVLAQVMTEDSDGNDSIVLGDVLHDMYILGQADPASATAPGFFQLVLASGHLVIDLANGLNQVYTIVQGATAVIIDLPIFTGGSLTGAPIISLYFYNDSTAGAHAPPQWAAAGGGYSFGPSISSSGNTAFPWNGSASKRTLITMQLNDATGAWEKEYSSTGDPY